MLKKNNRAVRHSSRGCLKTSSIDKDSRYYTNTTRVLLRFEIENVNHFFFLGQEKCQPLEKVSVCCNKRQTSRASSNLTHSKFYLNKRISKSGIKQARRLVTLKQEQRGGFCGG
jgi:hypothetical protein